MGKIQNKLKPYMNTCWKMSLTGVEGWGYNSNL